MVDADIFLPAREMDAVFNDDRVLVRVTGIDSKGRREGQIAEIVEHNTHQVVGKYREENGIAFVDPDNKLITQDIIIPENQRADAQEWSICHGGDYCATDQTPPAFRQSD